MSHKKEFSKAEITKMVIDQMTPEEKAELQKLLAADMPAPVKNKIELQVG